MKKLFIMSGLLWLIIILGYIFISCAGLKGEEKSGFDITFYNDRDKLRCYSLKWIDHPFTDQTFLPVSMAAGEQKPGKKHDVNNGYPSGNWLIHWYDCWHSHGDFSVERPLNITPDIRKVITTPTGDQLL